MTGCVCVLGWGGKCTRVGVIIIILSCKIPLQILKEQVQEGAISRELFLVYGSNVCNDTGKCPL